MADTEEKTELTPMVAVDPFQLAQNADPLALKEGEEEEEEGSRLTNMGENNPKFSFTVPVSNHGDDHDQQFTLQVLLYYIFCLAVSERSYLLCTRQSTSS